MPTYALYLTIDGYWTNRHDHKGWVDKTGQGQAWFWDFPVLDIIGVLHVHVYESTFN